MKLPTILNLLPVIGPVVAALPEFKALVDEAIDALDNKNDQAQLKAAYDRALVKAGDAHSDAQAAVREHG